MKNLLTFFGTLIISSTVNANTINNICSNSSGRIKLVVYSTDVAANSGLNTNELSIDTVTLMGPRKLTFNLNDLDIVEGTQTEYSIVTKSINTVCNIPQKSVDREVMKVLTFSRKDGKPMKMDDDGNQMIIKTTLLCDESVIDSWPCKD